MNVLDIVAVVAIIGFVIGRQLLGEQLRGRRLIVLPLVLTVVGASELLGHGHHASVKDTAFIVVSGIVAAGIGIGQGSMMRLEARGGTLWGQMPLRSLWLWFALVMSRLVVDVIASGAGAHLAASTTPILMTLGINRLAQALVVAPRAVAAGIPFAPERNGSTMLSGFFGTGGVSASQARVAAPQTDRRTRTGEWQSGMRLIVDRLSAHAQQR